MARNVGNAAAQSNAGKGAAGNTAGYEKGSGYLNFYLKDRSGAKIKLGYLALVDSNERQKKLVEWLKADPANVETLAAKLIVEFNAPATGEAAEFDMD